jgi:serine-type D-Ala-D-Ala carboxypeptidase/endopeptidase (penicillin-binding protein 4)
MTLPQRFRLWFATAFLFAIALPVIAQPGRPMPTPSVSPTPAASPSPVPIQTVADLQARIREILQWPSVRRGHVGVKIASLGSGRVVFEENAEKYFMPASNMKNFTVAAAIEKLSPDFRFVTSVMAPAAPDASGVLKGEVRIVGRGDVSFSPAFLPPHEGPSPDPTKSYLAGIDRLADAIAAAGVKQIEGNIAADESHFRGDAIPGSWELDDLQWYYGAEVSALPINDNAIEMSVLPSTAGYPCAVRILPPNPVIRVVNRCATVPAGSLRDMRVVRPVGVNTIEINGGLPVGDRGFNGRITVSRPAELFVALLKQRLELRGIAVTGGQKQTMNAPAHLVEIVRLESQPLSMIAAKTMKPSQNMYTETLLWTLGEQARQQAAARAANGPAGPVRTSAELGIAAVRDFLVGIGADPDAIIQHDGSGLSRHNLVTPAAVVHLYSYMAKQSRFAQAWRDSLTIGGVDGTLTNRFKGTLAANNVRGKTGTIDQVSALSGYVKTAAGEEMVFSVIVNGVNTVADRTALIDQIVLVLAAFNGKIDQ